jgi:peptide/nickel transport system substrate-binding protein
MLRRNLLLGSAALGAAGGLPRFAIGQAPRLMRFIPQSDVAVLDPIFTTAYVTRNHGLLVWDMLYAVDSQFRPQPQMAEGHTVEDDGKRWTIRLRPGMKWHDGTPVLARDCVASIQRWQRRDAVGQELANRTDELTAPDDRTIVFRLKRPFPLLPDALGKIGSPTPFMMPERIAKTDAFQQITEYVGSGPYRFNSQETVRGSRFVYDRFADYVPRQGGAPSMVSGPKVANFDRVEWRVTPDSATAAAALQSGEVDWWENPPNDLLPPLKRARDLVVQRDTLGLLGVGRFNHLHAPFNNQALRQAVLSAIQQADFMTAAWGSEPGAWNRAGFFPPGTPFASDAGLSVLASRTIDQAKAAVAASGYRGEKVVVLGATDFPIINPLALVGTDLMQKIGLNVEFVASDWGTLVQRRASREPTERGGWSIFYTYWSAFDAINPAVNNMIRGNGTNGWFGWAASEALEAQRSAWFDATDLAGQQAAARRQQEIAMQEVPSLPLGQAFGSTAHRRSVSGLLSVTVPMFWNVAKA